MRPNAPGVTAEVTPHLLRELVEWRQWLWEPPIKWLIGDPARFYGKRVLDIGTRFGGMSTLFAMLGAEVVGVDLPGVDLQAARVTAAKFKVVERTDFVNYSGKPEDLPAGPFDFVFSKSVLVVVRDLAKMSRTIAERLAPQGELLAAENFEGPQLLRWIRTRFIHRRWTNFTDTFHGVNEQFFEILSRDFGQVICKSRLGLVAAIRASLPRNST